MHDNFIADGRKLEYQASMLQIQQRSSLGEWQRTQVVNIGNGTVVFLSFIIGCFDLKIQ